MGACTCRTGWEGYTVETMLNSFGAERQLTSLWSRSVILRHVPYTCYTEQLIVKRKSRQLPPRHPFQQLGMSCTGLQLAIPAFAHRDTYWKITQSVDSGLLWNVWKRAAHPVLKSRQKNHFECRRHDRYGMCQSVPCCASTRSPSKATSQTAWNHFHDNGWFMPLCLVPFGHAVGSKMFNLWTKHMKSIE